VEEVATAARKYDYVTLEEEFVRGKMSVRELARQHGIPENRVSSIHEAAKKPDPRGETWYTKRAAYQNLSSDKTMALLADLEAKRRLRRVQVADHAIEVIDKAIGVLGRNLDPVVSVGEDGAEHTEYPKIAVRDLALLLDRLSPLFGQPTTVTLTEGRSLNVSGPTEITDGLIAGLAALAARPVGPGVPEPGAAGGSPLPSAPGPREDQ
jgi:hypothetical protein